MSDSKCVDKWKCKCKKCKKNCPSAEESQDLTVIPYGALLVEGTFAVSLGFGSINDADIIYFTVTRKGLIKNLSANVHVVGGGSFGPGEFVTYTVLKNHVATPLGLLVDAADTYFVNSTATVIVNPGDLIGIDVLKTVQAAVVVSAGLEFLAT